MMMSVLALVALQRLLELALARRNTARLRTQGAIEVGRRHYPLFVVLHAGWLGALALHPAPSPNPGLLALFAILMLARGWVILSLGRFWTTRIITLPGAPLVKRGPYRWLRHPNYLVVAAEIAVLPLAFGAWEIAIVFSALNGALLAQRIAVEEEVLTARGSSAASG